ncbi:MAG: M91 family zinc metallopeptidase, partial [Dysgonomonas sp.]
SSKGEFTEFHDQTDIVEIGSVLFNRRTKEIVKVLDKDETTIDISSATAAMSIDPLCEKYYWISPYAYVANNPIKFIDPDGRDIWIYYTAANNKPMAFLFNGSNHKSAPNNTFVKQFLQAYDHNVKNGGGENLEAAAKDRSTISRVIESENGKSRREHRKVGKAMKSFVVWNPEGGLETTDGKRMSPATVLEHEMDHERDYDTNTAEHNKNADANKGYDKQYETKEERRVITGSEAKTARANKEVPQKYTRPNHGGTRFRAKSPISNEKREY